MNARKAVTAAGLCLLLLTGFKCASTNNGGGYWLHHQQVWVGDSAPAGDWYPAGQSSDGETFWVLKGSEIDIIIRRGEKHLAPSGKLRR